VYQIFISGTQKSQPLTRAKSHSHPRVTRRRAHRTRPIAMFTRASHHKSAPRVAYVGPYAMDPLGAPVVFAQRLLTFVALWELVRQVLLRATHRAIRNPRNDAERRVKFEAPKQYTGAIHAVVVSVMAAMVLRDVCALPYDEDRYFNRSGNVGLSASQRDFLELANWIFLGYLVQDTMHILLQFPRLGKVDMVAHHLVFTLASVLSGASQTMMLPFAWLLLGEISTPLLTMRWTIQSATYSMQASWVIPVAKCLGYKGEAVSSTTNAGKQLEFFNGICLMITFFAVRVVSYTIGYTHMIWVRYKGIIDPVPAGVAWPLNILVGFGAGLNAYWFSIMIRKAIKGPPKPQPEGAKVIAKEY